MLKAEDAAGSLRGTVGTAQKPAVLASEASHVNCSQSCTIRLVRRSVVGGNHD
jgi:hypothetical protein